MAVADHDRRKPPQQFRVRLQVFRQKLLAAAVNGRQFFVRILRRTAQSGKMFWAGGHAFPLEPFNERPGPGDDFVGGPAPAAFAQRVINLLVEQFQVEHRREIEVDLKPPQPAASPPPELARPADPAVAFEVGNRGNLADDVAQAVDASVLLVDGDQRPEGKFGAQGAGQRAQFALGGDVPGEQYDAAGPDRVQQPPRLGRQLQPGEADAQVLPDIWKSALRRGCGQI